MNTRLLIIAHEPLAHALRECALHVFPDCAADVQALDVPPDEPPEATLLAARALSFTQGSAPLLVLTDLAGATPSNVAQRLVDGVHSRLVAGVNLPMLLRALTYRAEPLEVLAARALAGGAQGVVPVAAPAAVPQQA
ncbi:PTS system, ascorbate-specific IIA component [Oryzisolibacter propanilivorax]|uniref:PTS system, ascorbate-specific IIA component n=1 Tax=Oryzisolibacter propanilivorax TaxID=1527607 RepID=A0A1G9VRS7_9BURK|nr:PTS fructose transporter subunit IIA [Oryzisolibacter propanilivorax]SDM74899.1 PTS system, ascorbate-specific IIA component [Oryzisolibacter propanilivorax]